MPTEEKRAELSKKRGLAASYISDPKRRQKYIAEQGESERKGKLTEKEASRMDTSADKTIATEGKNVKYKLLGSFKKGGKVKKTGAYILHKGERVVPPSGACKMRSGKRVRKGMGKR